MATEVNAAIELAHTSGIVTAASLMVNGPAAADAVMRARRLTTLHVGLHLVLTDGRAVLPAEQIPDLVDARGNLRCDLAAFGASLALRPKARRQIAAEITAQFDAYRATGLLLDHVNSHHHFHLHPVIAGLILDIGARYGMRALRTPVEPIGVLRQVEPDSRQKPDWITAPWIALLRRRIRKRELATADRVFGLAWSGAMTEQRIAGIVRHLPDGVTEIYSHPALHGTFAGAANGYRYADELAALISPRIKSLVALTGARIGGFSDLGA